MFENQIATLTTILKDKDIHELYGGYYFGRLLKLSR